MFRRFPAVLFDLDGTLVDSSGDLAAALNHVLAEGSLPPASRAEVRRMVGDGAAALIERAYRRYGRAPDAGFVPGVVALALAVFAGRAWQGDPAAGLLGGMSVLLISCPCALGLAVPLASWHALRRAAKHGILIDSPATLERAAAVDRVFFDKTGTLTEPELALERITVAPGLRESQVLEWAASLESASTHPIARALLAASAARGLRPEIPQSFAIVAGLGIEGRVAGRALRLGRRRWLEGAPPATDEDPAVFLMDEKGVLARFDLDEAPRSEAACALADLRRMGMALSVLSGDRVGPTRRLAHRLGIAAEGELLPDDKVERLARARGSSGRVAMVGDGINDAPVLAAADVGIALGTASDLARRSGNVRLVSDRLDRIPLVFALARHARRRIRANLAWAFGFNSVGIALAAAGWLTPVFAAVAMVLSSLIVVRISSRAGQLSPAEDEIGAGVEPGLPDPSDRFEPERRPVNHPDRA